MGEIQKHQHFSVPVWVQHGAHEVGQLLALLKRWSGRKSRPGGVLSRFGTVRPKKPWPAMVDQQRLG